VSTALKKRKTGWPSWSTPAAFAVLGRTRIEGDGFSSAKIHLPDILGISLGIQKGMFGVGFNCEHWVDFSGIKKKEKKLKGRFSMKPMLFGLVLLFGNGNNSPSKQGQAIPNLPAPDNAAHVFPEDRAHNDRQMPPDQGRSPRKDCLPWRCNDKFNRV